MRKASQIDFLAREREELVRKLQQAATNSSLAIEVQRLAAQACIRQNELNWPQGVCTKASVLYGLLVAEPPKDSILLEFTVEDFGEVGFLSSDARIYAAAAEKQNYEQIDLGTLNHEQLLVIRYSLLTLCR